jgi:predicted RNA-binding Zn ribbon-like protein
LVKAHQTTRLLGGRLAIDFANTGPHRNTSPQQWTWDDLVGFLEAAGVVSHERRLNLLALPRSDSQAAELLLARALRLRVLLRQAFAAISARERIPTECIHAINEIMLVTEGHDELVSNGDGWKLEFIGREGGLDWLLAAIARSAAEIVAENSSMRLRRCANPACGLFFWDASRTHRRRWCSMSVCGNRHKVASFAKRRATR